MFEIIRTIPGDNQFNLFENFPKEIYPADSLAVKVPDSINYEYLEAGYLLTLYGQVKSRAALYNNPHLRYKGQKTLSIGNYETVDDHSAAEKLLGHLSARATDLGGEYIVGPMNGSTWDPYRFSTHHDHPHFFLEPYHHLYYQAHFLNHGFDVIAKYYSSVETDLKFNNPAVLQRQKEFEQAGVTFRNINLDAYENELERVFDFNGTAFKSNFLYTPISKADFMKKYAQTKKFIDPQYVVLAEDKDDNLIGYFFCIDNLYDRQSKTLIAKTVARHPDKKWGGTGHVLGNIICGRALNNGYTAIIHSFMYDEGTSKNMSLAFSGNAYKNYVLLGKPLK